MLDLQHRVTYMHAHTTQQHASNMPATCSQLQKNALLHAFTMAMLVDLRCCHLMWVDVCMCYVLQETQLQLSAREVQGAAHQEACSPAATS